MTHSYPRNRTNARMILNIIAGSKGRGATKSEIMKIIFLVTGRKEYRITEDRGKYSSYFATSKFQYGVVPRFCTKVGRRWFMRKKY